MMKFKWYLYCLFKFIDLIVLYRMMFYVCGVCNFIKYKFILILIEVFFFYVSILSLFCG